MAWYNNIFTNSKKPARKFKRSYTGANTGRLFADFLTTSTSADAEIKNNIRILRDRARELSRNDSYIARYLNLMISNVVGKHGIRVSSKARNDDGSLDIGANILIERAWKEWSNLGNCTANGRLSFLDCQKIFVETLCRDGEVLVRKIKSSDSPFGFTLQFLEADHLDENKNKAADKNGNSIKMGVEINKYGKPIAYHLFKKHPFDNTYPKPTQEYIRVPADEIIHAYIPQRAEQTRGVSLVATAMANVKMLNGYLEAEIVAARVGASKMGFFTSPDGDGYVGDGEMEDSYSPSMNAQAGVFEQLPAGMDFKAFDPNHPTSAFDSFTTSVLRSIASGLNISYHSLSNDLTSVNYSSIRQGALEDRSMYMIYQQFVIEHFVNPIFQSWLEMAISTGYINLPMGKFDKFANAINFIPRSFSWIDPLKEMQANIIGLQNGTTTYADISASAGRDVEELFEQHQKEIELAKQYDIEIAYQPFGQKLPVEAKIQGGDDDE
nr:phage portal protein [uncultured Mediterranean phage uvMED]